MTNTTGAERRPVMVFRLAGIYGPGQIAFDKLREGTARRIVKPGQVFNRIHVEDIAGVAPLRTTGLARGRLQPHRRRSRRRRRTWSPTRRD